MTMILASQSASRKAMLEAAGVPFEARAGDVDEGAIKRELIGVAPGDVAMVLAEAKALGVSVAAPG
ncbi:MAG: septum formation protein Maf, partial [Novosphingobium sp.]|nr:septum formation protein Maf [Novosphingobium sp.]